MIMILDMSNQLRFRIKYKLKRLVRGLKSIIVKNKQELIIIILLALSHMYPQKPSQMKKNSKISRHILYKLKKYLKKQKITSTKFAHDYLRPKTKNNIIYIEKRAFEETFRKFKLDFSKQEFQQLYTDLSKHIYGQKIIVSQLLQFIDTVQQIDDLEIGEDDYNNRICDYIHSQHSMEMMDGIQSQTEFQPPESSSVYQQSNSIDQEEKECFVKKQFNKNQSISGNQFQNKTGGNDFQDRTSRTFLQGSNNKANYQSWNCYLNDQSNQVKLEQKDQNLIKKFFNGRRSFQDRYNPSYGKAYLVKKNIQHCLFSSLEQNLNNSQKKSLVKDICSRDIVQGEVRNFPFLIAIAILASKYPSLIFRLFVLLKNPWGIYGIIFFVQGKWKTIFVDLSFPFNSKGHYCGASSYRNTVWINLLQKAFVKINGSYENLEDWSIQECLELLTGTTGFSSVSLTLEQKLQAECNERDNILICYLKQKSSKLSFDPYSIYIMESIVFNATKASPTLLQLSILYGNVDDWNQRLQSFTSQYQIQQLRNKFGYKSYPKDTTSFISKQDFIQFFSKEINIFKIKVNNKNSLFDLHPKNGELISLQINVKQGDNYCLNIYIKNQKELIKKYPEQQRQLWMLLIKREENKYKKVFLSNMGKHNKRSIRNCLLKKGQYILVLRMVWHHQQNQQYCLASYGPDYIAIKQKKFNESYLDVIFNSISSQTIESQYFKNSNISKKSRFWPNDGYGFIQVNNRCGCQQDIKIDFSQLLYVVSCLDSKHKIRLTIPQMSKILLKFIIPLNFNNSDYDISEDQNSFFPQQNKKQKKMIHKK